MKKPKFSLTLAVLGALVLSGVSGLATGTGTTPAGTTPAGSAPAGTPQTPAANGQYVTRAEYEQLKKQFEQLKAMFNAMKGKGATNAVQAVQTRKALDYVNKRVSKVQAAVKRSSSGFNRVVMAGDANVTFTSQQGSKSTFGAELSPLLLWQLSNRLLFEGGLDIGVDNGGSGGSGETSFDLSIAELSYLVNDYVAVGAGLFVVPFGVYHNHFDPPWINQLPDDPLPFGDGGIAPDSAIGIFADGAVPIRSTVLNYDFYVSNGPRLITHDPNAAGSLAFDNFDDNNSAKSFGGRIGFRPIPQLEFGYSMQYGQVGTGSYGNVDAFLQCVDAEYRHSFYRLRGQLDFRAEFVSSHVDRATYDATGSAGFGPLSFSNNRNGGTVQVGYRPLLVQTPFINKLQLVGRYDWLHIPLDAPGGNHEHRWTVGLDYWLQPNVVLKTAYELDSRTPGPSANAFLVQLGMGL